MTLICFEPTISDLENLNTGAGFPLPKGIKSTF